MPGHAEHGRGKRAVENVVPMALWHLLHANATWEGRPHARNAGSEMSPPPPATASTNPARKRIANRNSSVQWW